MRGGGGGIKKGFIKIPPSLGKNCSHDDSSYLKTKLVRIFFSMFLAFSNRWRKDDIKVDTLFL